MSDAKTTDVAVAQDVTQPGAIDVRDAVAGLNDPSTGFYSTITANTFAEKLALTKAIDESSPLDENLNVEFDLANYIVQVVEVANRDTGEVNLAPRVTLIDSEGKAYHGTSKGLLSSIKNLTATVGDPSNWEGNFIKVKVVEEGVKPRKYFTLKFI